MPTDAATFSATFETPAWLRTRGAFGRCLFKHTRRAFRDIGKSSVHGIRRDRLSGRPGLERRSGGLKRSLEWNVTGRGVSTLELTVGWPQGSQGAMIAVVQEEGRVIRPRRAKALKVPLPPALTTKGVLRARFNNLDRNDPRTFFVRKKGGNPKHVGTVFYREASGVVPIFALMTEVEVPARLGFFDWWNGGRQALRRRNRLLRGARGCLRELGRDRRHIEVW